MNASDLSNPSRDSLLSNLATLMSEEKVLKAKPAEPETCFFRIVKEYYTRTVDYRTNWLDNRSSKYKNMVASYIAMLVENLKSKMKSYFIDTMNISSIIEFMAKFKLDCNTNNIHEAAQTLLILVAKIPHGCQPCGIFTTEIGNM